MYEWMKIYPQFKDTYEYCKELQHSILIEWTMLWFFKDNFTQFLLKNDFEYKDQSEVKITDATNTNPDEDDEDTLRKKLAEIRKKKDTWSPK